MDNRYQDPDELLRAAGRQVREQIEAEDAERLDRRWDNSCTGALAAALFEPLGDEFKADLVRKLGQARNRKPVNGKAGPRPTWAAEIDRKLGPIRRWWQGLADHDHFRGLGLAAVAAGLIAVAGLYQLARPGVDPVTRFQLEVLGAAVERSSAEAGAEAVLLEPGLRFRIRLQPEKPMTGRVDLRVYVRPPGGAVERWRGAERAATVYPGGTVLIEDPEWEFSSGDWTLYLAAGRSLPPDSEMRRLLARGSPPPAEDWHLLVKDLRVGAARDR